jgi:hypothetical protein
MVVAGVVIFNILELIMKIMPNYPIVEVWQISRWAFEIWWGIIEILGLFLLAHNRFHKFL